MPHTKIHSNDTLRTLRSVIDEVTELFDRGGLQGVQGFSITVRLGKSTLNLSWGDLKIRKRKTPSKKK